MLGTRLGLAAAGLRCGPAAAPVTLSSRVAVGSPLCLGSRAASSKADLNEIDKIRNIGISAHIDSGKTTLTERILYYTGRIDSMHEVRGKDEKGATMDSMELEREKGITIQSAATYTTWKDTHINIIDTPGHVDFTIEVERALRVLDGAVLVLCSVGGVQSQTITVDRQMRRYNVPRIAFINKMDRMGSNPERVTEQLRTKLHLNAAPIQIPIGYEDKHAGAVDLITMEAIYYDGDNGETVRRAPIPDDLVEKAETAREALIEAVSDVDDELALLHLEGEEVDSESLKAAVRRQTIGLEFVPVMVGSAFKNKGVQALLDAVGDYLPNPTEVTNTALDINNDEAEIELQPDPDAPFVGLAFKLEETPHGQLTYMRVYQGTLKQGGNIHNLRADRKHKVPRLVRMHSNSMEDVASVGPGEICAMFGLDCASGDTFLPSPVKQRVSMTSMFVPDPVISLAITPPRDKSGPFSKALSRFQREDPTFRVHLDKESNETVISGMGELHLQIYAERLRREYDCDCTLGQPRVAFRETPTTKAKFDYTHKKQTGGSGQFGRVSGYIEPIEGDGTANEFVNNLIGNAIPPEFVAACRKGFEEACEKGSLTGNPIIRCRFVLEDGLAHSVDSNELAFRMACIHAVRSVQEAVKAVVLEPIMKVDVSAPTEFQGTVIAMLNKRKGIIEGTETQDDYVNAIADVPLNDMFGFSTDLRSATQGKGEFSMEYKTHAPVQRSLQAELMDAYQKEQAEGGSR